VKCEEALATVKRSVKPFIPRRCIAMVPASLRGYRSIGTKRFFILSHPRSGSNFLRNVINQHPRVNEAGEPFHINPAVAVLPSVFLGKELLCLDDLDRCLTNVAAKKRVEAIGFTLFNQTSSHLLSDSEAAQLALRDDLKVIFLIRKNLLKSFVSLKRAVLTGAWHLDAAGELVHWPHSHTPADALDRHIGPIDVEETKLWISRTKEFLSCVEQSLRSQGKEYCTIFYEDLCLESESRSLFEVNRMLEFLKLKKLRRFTQTLSKVASHSFYESIPNRQELIDAVGYDLD
jgi:LPS sulfotransferase NodH